MAVSAARWAAFQVLHRVESAGAFAADVLHSRLALDERDLGLAEELALGVLRWQGQLDRLIGEAAGRPLESLDPEVLLALRLGAYQLRRLDRIPARAAVSESVEIVKRARKASAAGLVNAVLRKLATHAALPGPPQPEWAVPQWLLDRWRRAYGDAVATKIALSTLEIPPTYLRLNARFDPEETLQLLGAQGVETAPTELAYCRKVLSGRPDRTECFRQGRVRIQDLGSQRIAPLLGADPPQRFLDVCAAPGSKTFQALEQWRERPRVAIAGDLYHHRLVTMRRLGTLPVALVTLDASTSLPFSASFHRILADVPCTGTGTLARNPEIKWKLEPADIEDLASRQKAILARALEALAPGGRLVYSTCSLEPEENEAVVQAVVTPPFERQEVQKWTPGVDEGDGFFACAITRSVRL